MTNELKQYIEQNQDLLESNINLLIFDCDGGGLHREELITILSEAGIDIPETDVTETDIIKSLRQFAKQVDGKLTVSKNRVVKYTWPDGDLTQVAYLDDLIDYAAKSHLTQDILKEDPGIFLDCFD